MSLIGAAPWLSATLGPVIDARVPLGSTGSRTVARGSFLPLRHLASLACCQAAAVRCSAEEKNGRNGLVPDHATEAGGKRHPPRIQATGRTRPWNRPGPCLSHRYFPARITARWCPPHCVGHCFRRGNGGLRYSTG